MHSPVMLRLVDHFWIFNSMIQTARHKAIYRFFTVKSFYKSKTYLQQKHRWWTVMVTVKIYKVENNLDKKKRLFSCILSAYIIIVDIASINRVIPLLKLAIVIVYIIVKTCTMSHNILCHKWLDKELICSSHHYLTGSWIIAGVAGDWWLTDLTSGVMSYFTDCIFIRHWRIISVNYRTTVSQ